MHIYVVFAVSTAFRCIRCLKDETYTSYVTLLTGHEAALCIISDLLFVR